MTLWRVRDLPEKHIEDFNDLSGRFFFQSHGSVKQNLLFFTKGYIQRRANIHTFACFILYFTRLLMDCSDRQNEHFSALIGIFVQIVRATPNTRK